MAIAYYSTVFDHPAERVWSVVRDFAAYSVYLPGTEAKLLNRSSGDAVGAIREVKTTDRVIRQQLLALSDCDRSQTYCFCDPSPLAVQDYRATLRITPVTDGNRSFLEWWASFDCAPEERERWIGHFRDNGFAIWLGALRRHLAA